MTMTRPVALITGASRGIGNALARALAEDGFDVIAVARDQHKLEQLATALHREFGIDVIPVAVDLADFSAAAALVSSALAQCGRLDVLVHCAGIFHFGTNILGLDQLQQMFDTNVAAVHNITQIGLPLLRKADKSYIFSIASIAGVEPFAAVGGYAASKHALVGYTRSLARQEISNGVRVTAICPDVVDTDMAAGSGMSPEQMISRKDIVHAVRFAMALSDSATLETICIGCKPVQTSIRHSEAESQAVL